MWGKLHHAARRRRRRRHAHRTRRPDRAERRRTRCRSARSASSSSTTTPGRTARRTPRRPACGGFQVGLEEQTDSAVTVDYNNNPLCGGDLPHRRRDGLRRRSTTSARRRTSSTCTRRTGRATATRTAAGTRPRRSTAACSCRPPVEEGSDGTGAPGEQLWEPPNNRTAYWFGFVCAPHAVRDPGHRRDHRHGAQLAGLAAVRRAGTFGEPGREPVRRAVATRTTDRTVFVGQGDGAGNFDIQNVPAGTYNLAIWDEQLSYIMRFKPVTVDRRPDRRRQRHRRRRRASASASRAGSAGSTATSTRT